MAESLTSSLRPVLRPTDNQQIDMTEPVGFVELMQLEKADRLQQYASLGMTQSQLRSAANNYDTRLQNEMMQLLLDEAFSSDQGSTRFITRKIRQGDLTSLSKISNGLYNSVSYLNSTGMAFIDIASELRTRRVAFLQAEEAEQNANDRANAEVEAAATARIIRAIAAGETDVVNSQIDLLDTLNPEAAAKFRVEFAEAGNVRTTSDDGAIRQLLEAGNNVKFSDVERLRDEKKLSNDDATFYFNKVDNLRSASMQAAKEFLRGRIQIPVDLKFVDDTPENQKRLALYNNAISTLVLQKDMATRTGTDFNPLAEAQTLLSELKVKFDEEIEANAITEAQSIIGSFKRINEDAELDFDKTDLRAAKEFFDAAQIMLNSGQSLAGIKADDSNKNLIAIAQQKINKALGL